MPSPAKTLITYQGGSGGDMFASSANGIAITLHRDVFVRQAPFSIKHLEHGITSGQYLEQLLDSIGHQYVTTHCHKPLNSYPGPVIEIVFADPAVIECVILRQMRLQNLKLDHAAGQTFPKLIRNLAQRKQWEQAARLWFDMAHERWHQERQQRMIKPLPHSLRLCFDRLFQNDFVDSLQAQGFDHNLALLRQNHAVWLLRNGEQARHITIDSMARKISLMDWR